MNKPAHLVASNKPAFEFGRDYTLALTKALWESPEKLLIAVKDFDSKLLEDPAIPIIFDFIRRYAEGAGHAPTRATIVAQIQDISKSDMTMRSRLLDLLSEIENCQIQPHYAIEKFKQYAIRQKIRSNYKEIADLPFNNFQIDRASNQVSQLLKDIQDIGNNDHLYNPLDLNKNPVTTSLNRIYLSRQNPVKTGVVALDKAMGGGLQKGCLYFIIGAAGTMKSMTMMNIAYQAVAAGKKVAYVDLENPSDMTLTRFLTRFSGLTSRTIMHNMDVWTEQQMKAITDAENTMKKNINFLNFSITGKNKVEDLDAFVQSSRKDMPFDLLIIDSPMHMSSYEATGLKATHEIQHVVYKKVKGMAQKYQVPVVCPIQFGRDGNRKQRNSGESADRQDVAGSFEAINLADMVVLLKKINKDQSGNRGNWIVWHIDKLRNGEEDSLRIACQSDLTRLITHDPSLPQQIVVGKSAEDIMNEVAQISLPN